MSVSLPTHIHDAVTLARVNPAGAAHFERLIEGLLAEPRVFTGDELLARRAYRFSTRRRTLSPRLPRLAHLVSQLYHHWPTVAVCVEVAMHETVAHERVQPRRPRRHFATCAPGMPVTQAESCCA